MMRRLGTLRPRWLVSNVEVTVRYHLMTHTLFLAILCLTTVFDDYLSIVSITYSLPITD